MRGKKRRRTSISIDFPRNGFRDLLWNSGDRSCKDPQLVRGNGVHMTKRVACDSWIIKFSSLQMTWMDFPIACNCKWKEKKSASIEFFLRVRDWNARCRYMYH